MREKDRPRRQLVMDNTGGTRSGPNGAGRPLTGCRRTVCAFDEAGSNLPHDHGKDGGNREAGQRQGRAPRLRQHYMEDSASTSSVARTERASQYIAGKPGASEKHAFRTANADRRQAQLKHRTDNGWGSSAPRRVAWLRQQRQAVCRNRTCQRTETESESLFQRALHRTAKRWNCFGRWP